MECPLLFVGIYHECLPTLTQNSLYVTPPPPPFPPQVDRVLGCVTSFRESDLDLEKSQPFLYINLSNLRWSFSFQPAQNQKDFCGEIALKDAHISVGKYNKELIFGGWQFFTVPISNTSSNTINLTVFLS